MTDTAITESYVTWTPPGSPHLLLRAATDPLKEVGPSRARIFTKYHFTASGHEGLADAGALVASELVTNALRHAGCCYLFVLAARDGALVGVWDPSDEMPVRKNAADDDESGRGLAVVEAVCDDLRWYCTVPNGKNVLALFERLRSS